MNTRDLSRRVNNWTELTGKQRIFDKSGQEWVFRGQSNNWPLASSLERAAKEFGLDRPRILPALEISLILEFIRHYHLYGSEAAPRQGDTLDWLALMRHHGAPTRLLDFTFSFQVAAYFALEEKGDDPIVYAVNKTWLVRMAKRWTKTADKKNNMYSAFVRLGKFREGRAFRTLFFESEQELVQAVSPFRRSQRLAVQSGIFLCPGTIKQPFWDLLKKPKDWRQNVIVTRISPKKRNEFLGFLDRGGLSRASLFPGLDGYAQSLRTRMLLLARLQRMKASRARLEPNIGLETLAEW